MGAIGARDRSDLCGDQAMRGRSIGDRERPCTLLYQSQCTGRGMAQKPQTFDGRGALWKPGGGNRYYLSSRFLLRKRSGGGAEACDPAIEGMRGRTSQEG